MHAITVIKFRATPSVVTCRAAEDYGTVVDLAISGTWIGIEEPLYEHDS